MPTRLPLPCCPVCQPLSPRWRSCQHRLQKRTTCNRRDDRSHLLPQLPQSRYLLLPAKQRMRHLGHSVVYFMSSAVESTHTHQTAHTCMHTHTHQTTHACARMYTHTHVHTHTHTLTHTHTHLTIPTMPCRIFLSNQNLSPTLSTPVPHTHSPPYGTFMISEKSNIPTSEPPRFSVIHWPDVQKTAGSRDFSRFSALSTSQGADVWIVCQTPRCQPCECIPHRQ